MPDIIIPGRPNPRQQLFFDSRARYTAYGGARGGGKSWALRRKLVALALNYPGIRCLLIRRTYPELRANHVEAFLREYGVLLSYSESDKRLTFDCGSFIQLGFCANMRDTLRYQGQEYDIIAIDEATQLTEEQFSIFKACLRGIGNLPRRIYLTCNPGGVGHSWVKRLFVDREFREGERPDDYNFIPARVWDNTVLTESSPEYVSQLKSLPKRLRDAWLDGRWDVFDGQFFPEFDADIHAGQVVIPNNLRRFAAMDYGFDMLAVLFCGADLDGNIWVTDELLRTGLTLGEAAQATVSLLDGCGCDYIVASPDLWNRRQDSGLSGVEIMTRTPGMPPMKQADDRRIPGWRAVREYLAGTRARRDGDLSRPSLFISPRCRELCHSLTSLLCDPHRPEDAAGEPHAITHAPEALRYALMSRASPPDVPVSSGFTFSRKHSIYDF